MKRFIPLLIILAACGDAADPLPSGPIVLTAEVRHVDPHPYTCEYRITADAAELSDPATWLRGTSEYSDASGTAPLTAFTFWGTGQIGPSEVLTSDTWYGHGGSRAWTGRVTWVYESRGVTDSASVTFDCD